MDMEEKNIPDDQSEPVSEPAPPPEETSVSPEAPAQAAAQATAQEAPRPTKFCSHCGGKIDEKAVVCPLCGCQVEQMAQRNPNIVINNSNANSNVNTQTTTVVAGVPRTPRNKWVALLLCLFLGILGAHKFYEGKTVMGVLYLFTGGLCGIGALADFISLLFKPNPYYV